MFRQAEHREKLRNSLRFPAQPDAENRIRNAAIKQYRPPQNFVSRAYKRDWDPRLSSGIEEFTRLATETEAQEEWISHFSKNKQEIKEAIAARMFQPKEQISAED